MFEIVNREGMRGRGCLELCALTVRDGFHASTYLSGSDVLDGWVTSGRDAGFLLSLACQLESLILAQDERWRHA